MTLQTRDGRQLQAPLKGDNKTNWDDKATQAPLDMKALRDLLNANNLSSSSNTTMISRQPGVWEPIVLDDEDPDASSNLFTPGPAIVLVDIIPGGTKSLPCYHT